jgi:hypothetical protein
MKKSEIVYYNSWGNRIVLYSGTFEQCRMMFEKNVEKYEDLDAHIEQ